MHNNNDNNNDDVYEILLNTFIIYYKKTYPTDNIKTMFDNINREGDTNKILESFYEAIVDYNHSEHKEALNYSNDIIHEINKDDYYVLKNNNIPTKISDNIIALLIEVINNEYKEWYICDL